MTVSESPPPLSLDKAQRLALVVWSAITVTVLLLGAAALSLVDPSSPAQSTPERDAFLNIFPILAAVNLLGSAVIFRFIKGRAKPTAQSSAHAHAEAANGKRYMGFFGAMVVSCALHEAIAVLGVVLSLISKNFSDMLPYLGTSLVANLLVFPSKRRLGKF